MKLPLLHKRALGYHAGEEWLWEGWFTRLGLRERPREAIRFTAIGPAIAAALEGAGAVLARSILVQDALAAGRLVRLLPESQDQLSSKVHVVRWPARLSGDARVATLTSWLVETADEASRTSREG